MLFTGDVQCVFCGSKIKFLGNIIIYQSQQCSNHNQEHQFPGMNIVVDGAHKTNTCGIHLPGTNQRKSSTKCIKILVQKACSVILTLTFVTVLFLLYVYLRLFFFDESCFCLF